MRKKLNLLNLIEEGNDPFEKMVFTSESMKKAGVSQECIIAYVKSFQEAHPEEEYRGLTERYLLNISGREYNSHNKTTKRLNNSI